MIANTDLINNLFNNQLAVLVFKLSKFDSQFNPFTCLIEENSCSLHF